MNFRTPLVASVAVLSALGGVAAAAIALPSSPPKSAAAAVQPVATATPEVQTKTIRRTIHVVRKDRSDDSGSSNRSSSSSTPVSTAAPARTAVPAPARAVASTSSRDDSGHHSGGDDDSGHHSGGDDDSGHGRGRGRGGDDD
jgi:hypothetical protein